MPAPGLTFHLPPDARLRYLLNLCAALQQLGNPACKTRIALIARARQAAEIPKRQEVGDFAHRLGLIEHVPEGWQLSPLAFQILLHEHPVQRDLMHYLAYSAWTWETASTAPFWSYQHTVDYLWTCSRVDLSTHTHDLVEEVRVSSRTTFEGYPNYVAERVVYNIHSVRGVLSWLRELDPPVIVERLFARRQTCSAELIALALGQAARQAGIGAGNDLLLSQERREAVCRICLLEPGYLDRLLDWAIPRFPELLAPGMRGGSYGRSVRLLRLPAVEDLAQDRKYP